jgi:tRNA threonylcarbamoyladenosine biosynthesis protein TsaE
MDDRAAFAAELTSGDTAETRRIGVRIGAAAGPGALLALVGPLGAGKTQLAKGVAEGLGIATVVNSPTFILMNEHRGRLTLYHVDAYRLDDPLEAIEAGLLDERHDDGVTVVEWADRLGAWLPASRLEIDIARVEGTENARTLRIRAWGDEHVALAARALGTDAALARAASASVS